MSEQPAKLSEADAVVQETYFDFEHEWHVVRFVLDYPGETLPFLEANLRPEHFAWPAAAELYREAIEAFGAGAPLTWLSFRARLSEQAARRPDEFSSRLEELSRGNGLDGIANAKRVPFCPPLKVFDYYATRLRNLAAKRETRRKIESLMAWAEQSRAPADQWFEEAGEHLKEIGESAGSRVVASTRYYGEPLSRPERPEVIRTGYSILDQDWGGMRPGQTIVVGGFTGHGKSMMMMNLAVQISQRDVRVLIVNLEMQTDEFEARIDSKLAQVSARAIINGEITDDQLGIINAERAKLLESKTLILPDRPSCELGQIMALCQREIAANGVQVCVIDFIQRVDVRRRFPSDYAKTTHITRQLSDFARRNRVCLILGSQLNREIQKRPAPTGSYVVIPKLSDLRDSGSIAEDADRVLLLYYPDRDRMLPENPDLLSGKLFVSCAKNRSEEVGYAFFNLLGNVSTINLLERSAWPKLQREPAKKATPKDNGQAESPAPEPAPVPTQTRMEYADADIPF